jgi:hypothetical protein
LIGFSEEWLSGRWWTWIDGLEFLCEILFDLVVNGEIGALVLSMVIIANHAVIVFVGGGRE